MTSNPELGLVSLPVISLIPGSFPLSTAPFWTEVSLCLLTDACASAHCNMASYLYRFTETVHTEIINTTLLNLLHFLKFLLTPLILYIVHFFLLKRLISSDSCLVTPVLFFSALLSKPQFPSRVPLPVASLLVLAFFSGECPSPILFFDYKFPVRGYSFKFSLTFWNVFIQSLSTTDNLNRLRKKLNSSFIPPFPSSYNSTIIVRVKLRNLSVVLNQYSSSHFNCRFYLLNSLLSVKSLVFALSLL